MLRFAIVLLVLNASYAIDFSNFDHLGLDVFNLSPEELQLSQAAEQVSAKKLIQLGVAVDNDQHGSHHRAKRGYKKGMHTPGYFALPIQPLPSNVNEDKVRLFTKPNRRLISLANQISHRRQGVLPPTVNNIPPSNGQAVSDPFILTPQTSSGYPNSIQDILHTIEEKPPSDDGYPPPYTPPDDLKYHLLLTNLSPRFQSLRKRSFIK